MVASDWPKQALITIVVITIESYIAVAAAEIRGAQKYSEELVQQEKGEEEVVMLPPIVIARKLIASEVANLRGPWVFVSYLRGPTFIFQHKRILIIATPKR